jgi:hypothetical protein
MKSGLNKTDTSCQPCENFTHNEIDREWWGHASHCCPDCDGIRWLCGTCGKDHHEGGWNSCRVTEAMLSCRHASCKKKCLEGGAK